MIEAKVHIAPETVFELLRKIDVHGLDEKELQQAFREVDGFREKIKEQMIDTKLAKRGLKQWTS